MLNSFTRRRAISSTFAALAVTGIPVSAYALTNDRAIALVNRVVDDINRVIAKGIPLSSMIKEFENIFRRYGDVNIIARSTLGADARRASSAQMKAYTEAFRGYIARKYGRRFNEFVGGRIEVNSVRKVKSWHEVKSTAFLRGESPFEVKFLVSDRSGTDRFFDMIIEGISLRLSERTEIGAMLDQLNGDIDALTANLRQLG